MTVFNYISHNFDQIKKETWIGLIPCSVLKHWEIYSRYDYYLKTGNSPSRAILYASDDFKITVRWGYKIIKKMGEEI